MSDNQPIQQTNQATGQPSKLEPVKNGSGVVAIPVDALVKLSKESTSKAADALVAMLAEFFHFSGLKDYMVIEFKLDTPTDPFGISVILPDAEGDLDNGRYGMFMR